MAKIITANKLKRFWQLGVVAKMVAKVRVLNSMEEIEANTNAENVAGAMAVAELSNNLGGIILTYENGKYYIQAGADAASKKQLGNVSFQSGKSKTTKASGAATNYTITQKGRHLICCTFGGLWGYNVTIKVNSTGNYSILCNEGNGLGDNSGVISTLAVIDINANAGDTISFTKNGINTESIIIFDQLIEN